MTIHWQRNVRALHTKPAGHSPLPRHATLLPPDDDDDDDDAAAVHAPLMQA